MTHAVVSVTLTKGTVMVDRKIVSKEQWLIARLEHLAKEK